MAPHISVLLNEVVEFFAGIRIEYFVDGTLGAGGHSKAILESHPEIKMLIGIDQDPIAREIALQRLAPWQEKVKIIPGNFSDLPKYLSSLAIKKVDGILLDIGVSSMQFDLPEKGFSFMHDGPLDMRMDPNNELTAELIINTWSESELGKIFREYGEEKRWRLAARKITETRKEKPITTTLQLAEILKKALPVPFAKRGIHPATLIFQALRIAVNEELDVLKKILPEAINALNSRGRLAVISFHSLEDRIVKDAMRFAASDKMNTDGIGGMFLDKDPTVTLLTKKPIEPSDEEVAANPRSRSAKLRVVEKR